MMDTQIGATAYARRFGAIYLCGHALNGAGDPISLEDAQHAQHRAYHWAPCLYCLRSGVPLPLSSLRYMVDRHPYAPSVER